MEQVQKIAVIGGTGKAGRYLVEELVKQGFRIRTLLRNPDKLRNDSGLIERVKGDVTVYDDVYSLLQGCDALISTVGPSKGQEPLYSQAAFNIIRAMNELNIKRYIVVTGMILNIPGDRKGFRARVLTGMMKFVFPAIAGDRQKEYSILSASTLDWTLVRLPYIDQAGSQGPIRINLNDCPGNRISATDLASFLINQLFDEEFIRKAPFIAN